MNNIRKLATIRLIKEILPINGADNIELAKIDGWQCVCKKGEFSPENIGVYFEIDSFLPVENRYEFLRKSCYRILPSGKEGFRLKTVKLKGELSQGLLLPISLFPELTDTSIGLDLTQILNISLYDTEHPIMSGDIKGIFPSFIPKTDEERIQNLWHKYSVLYQNVGFEITTKLDGTSCTIYYNKETDAFGVCSRNLEKKSGDCVYWQIAKKYDMENKMRQYGKSIAIQGEIVGPGIQKNKNKLDNVLLFVFNIYDIENRRYLTTKERRDMMLDINSSIPHVPINEVNIKIFQKFNNIQELLEYADGPLLNGFGHREGIVAKAILPSGENISFKVINNKYLLEE